MPELPDILAYRKALEDRVVGEVLQAVRLASPFLLRTVEPPLAEAQGRRVLAVRRIGKRIVLALWRLLVKMLFKWPHKNRRCCIPSSPNWISRMKLCLFP